MKRLAIPAVMIFALMAASCQSSNTNKVFASLDPSSKQYKQELAKQVIARGTDDLTFTFNSYINIAGKEYLDVNINGNGMQAKSLILVNNWDKLEGIKRTKGMSYHGAQLKNLKLSIDNTSAEPTFVYEGLDRIID